MKMAIFDEIHRIQTIRLNHNYAPEVLYFKGKHFFEDIYIPYFSNRFSWYPLMDIFMKQAAEVHANRGFEGNWSKLLNCKYSVPHGPVQILGTSNSPEKLLNWCI